MQVGDSAWLPHPFPSTKLGSTGLRRGGFGPEGIPPPSPLPMGVVWAEHPPSQGFLHPHLSRHRHGNRRDVGAGDDGAGRDGQGRGPRGSPCRSSLQKIQFIIIILILNSIFPSFLKRFQPFRIRVLPGQQGAAFTLKCRNVINLHPSLTKWFYRGRNVEIEA